jgi:hypothetical protein
MDPSKRVVIVKSTPASHPTESVESENPMAKLDLGSAKRGSLLSALADSDEEDDHGPATPVKATTPIVKKGEIAPALSNAVGKSALDSTPKSTPNSETPSENEDSTSKPALTVDNALKLTMSALSNVIESSSFSRNDSNCTVSSGTTSTDFGRIDSALNSAGIKGNSAFARSSSLFSTASSSSSRDLPPMLLNWNFDNSTSKHGNIPAFDALMSQVERSIPKGLLQKYHESRKSRSQSTPTKSAMLVVPSSKTDPSITTPKRAPSPLSRAPNAFIPLSPNDDMVATTPTVRVLCLYMFPT